MEITIKFGSRMTVKSSGESQKDAMLGLGIFADATPKCGHCGSDAITPGARRTKENHTYFELKCADCGHVQSLGQNKDGEGLFPKGDWEPPYQGSGERRESSAPPANDPFYADDDGSEVPF